MKCVMKYMKKAEIYKNSTGSCTYDPRKEEAHSYSWWCFLKRINGKLVFNNYSYSVSTTAHQSRIRSMLSNEGIEIDLFIESPRGLDNLSSAVNHYMYLIDEAREKLTKPRIRTTTKVHLGEMICTYKLKITQIFELNQIILDDELKEKFYNEYK